MRYSLLLLILAMTVSSSIAQVELTPVWVNRYAKTPGNQPHEIPAGLGVDNNGNVYVTMSEAVDDWRRWITIKLGSDTGALLWENYVQSENGLCEPAGLVVEENGSNLYATGYRRLGENGKDDYFTVNYNGSSGGAVWETIFGLEDHDRAKAITMDDDYVYVTGYIDEWEGGAGQDHAFCTIKYDKEDGETAWVRTYNPTSNDDEACAIAVHNGNVYVTGRCWEKESTGSRWDWVTIKYNSSGVQQWDSTFDFDKKNDEPTSIAVDGNENIYITGIAIP
jgi:Beta-propeller repeat